MLKITNIPNEVYISALNYEGFESYGEGREVESYQAQAQKRGTNGGLERALSDYLLRTGDFAEGARFEEVSGYEA